MAVAVSIPTNTDGRLDDVRALKRRVRLLTLTDNYSTGGEVVSAQSVGLKRILAANVLSTAAETDLTGAWIVRVDVASNGRQANVVLYEAAAAGGVFTQKPAEAYESASSVLVEFIGY